MLCLLPGAKRGVPMGDRFQLSFMLPQFSVLLSCVPRGGDGQDLFLQSSVTRFVLHTAPCSAVGLFTGLTLASLKI